MRIAHVEAGRHLYGGAAQVNYLLEGLTGRGVENLLFCPKDCELGAAATSALVRALPMRGELDATLLPRLAAALKRAKPDLVHVHSRRGADLYGGLAAALAGVPAVVTRRVDAAEPALLARLKYRSYRAVVALSHAIERQLVAAGVARERIVLIPSGIDTERYRPDPAARERLRAAFALRADALVVGVVAQLIERKRHSWLFASLPELLREWPQLAVVCFGRGPLEGGLLVELAERGLTGRVVLAGFRSDLPALVPGLDVLAHPAGREGLGLALLEAASAGVPVVACAVGGVPDAVVDGETGLLVGRDDASGMTRALRSLLGSPETRARFGAAARRHVERRFDVSKLVGAHHSLYTRVLGERAAAAAPVGLE
ncbi:MAG TPA: glycosyltransferase [Gammaproteobacteria bacterium]|nr:glycosyltransferase [Gammaproteobacteria bacterium]